MEADFLRLAGIVEESIVDGHGFRYTVFVQGCPHHCPGCHNPQTHAFSGGTMRSVDDIFSDFCKNPLLKGITFSGGEPFCQPEALAHLASLVHTTGKDVTVYTGYTWEELLAMQQPEVDRLLAQTDILIDGPFRAEEKDLTLRFRGSRNQRIIDLNRTRLAGTIVLDCE